MTREVTGNENAYIKSANHNSHYRMVMRDFRLASMVDSSHISLSSYNRA